MPELIYQVLEQEHKEMRALLTRMEATEAPGERTRLLGQFARLAVPHQEAEERAFYQPLRRRELTEDLTREGKEEHRVISKELTTLQGLPADDDQWGARLQVFKEIVEHHIREEEKELFDKARDILDEAEAIQMAADFTAAKAEVPTPS